METRRESETLTTLCRAQAQRHPTKKQPVEVEIAIHTADIDIDYRSPTGGMTKRCVRPVGLRLLKHGEVAIIAHCRLREEYRTFAFDRIVNAQTYPDTGRTMNGHQLSQTFHSDISRLFLYEEFTNQPVSQSGKNGNSFTKPRTGKSPCATPSQGNPACQHVSGKIPAATTTALKDLQEEMMKYAEDLCIQAGQDEIAIMATIEVRQDGHRNVYVDTPGWAAGTARAASSHARIAYLRRRSGIVKALRSVHDQAGLSSGSLHDGTGPTIAMHHQAGARVSPMRVALDRVWINIASPDAGTIARHIERHLANPRM